MTILTFYGEEIFHSITSTRSSPPFHATLNWPIAQSRSCFVIKFSLSCFKCAFCPLYHRHNLLTIDLMLLLHLIFTSQYISYSYDMHCSQMQVSLDVRPPVECCSRRQRRPSLCRAPRPWHKSCENKNVEFRLYGRLGGRVMSAAALLLFLC